MFYGTRTGLDNDIHTSSACDNRVSFHHNISRDVSGGAQKKNHLQMDEEKPVFGLGLQFRRAHHRDVMGPDGMGGLLVMGSKRDSHTLRVRPRLSFGVVLRERTEEFGALDAYCFFVGGDRQYNDNTGKPRSAFIRFRYLFILNQTEVARR